MNSLSSSAASAPLTPATPSWIHCDLLQSELAALQDKDLLLVNLDIETLTSRMFVHAPELRRVEAELQAHGCEPSTERVTKIEQAALALRDAHRACVELKGRIPSASALVTELSKLRMRLLAAVKTLVEAGVIDVRAIAAHRGVNGQRAVARSVCGLVRLLCAHWQALQQREVALSAAELERALALAQELSLLLQGKHDRHAALERAERERQRLFTLLLREYAALRRAARELYGAAEAQRRVPSLYGANSVRGRLLADT